MPLAQLSITLPEGTWVREVSRDATVRVLAGMPGEDAGLALVEIVSPDLEAVLRGMVEHDGLTDVEPLQRSDDRMVLQIETPAPLLLVPMQAAGVPIEPPVTITDGVAELDVRTSHDRLSALGEQLDRFGLEYTVDAIREDHEAESLLSDHQAELLETALACGYYDTPRTCSLTELADRVGIAKSTCSETLHRAEGHVVRRFVETHLSADLQDRPSEGPASVDTDASAGDPATDSGASEVVDPSGATSDGRDADGDARPVDTPRS